MKILKRVLIAAAIIIAIPLLLGLFIEKDYTIQREVVIDKPEEQVFAYVKLLKNQDTYNKWVMADPGMKKDFKGTDGTAGFVYAWESNDDNVGKGEQEIKKISENERLEHEIRFIKPFEGLAYINMVTEPLSESRTKVKWSFQSAIPYPMNVMRIVMDIEGIFGSDMQESLNNLKTVLEKQ